MGDSDYAYEFSGAKSQSEKLPLKFGDKREHDNDEIYDQDN